MIKLINIRNIILDEFYGLCKDDLKFSNFKEDLYNGNFEGTITFEDNIEIEIYYDYNNYKYCTLKVKSIDFKEMSDLVNLKDFFNTLYDVSYKLYNIEREEE